MNRLSTTLLCLGTTFLFSCQHVEPWQRATLAKTEMSFSPNPMQQKLTQQVYFSKEAASGGNQTAGAGCGCN
ncbi:MAG: DUF4266 domain-containing protein [Pseudomonadales bacterium]|nr:DUF4266 domain-containing protein [Pseudomonadales bacterium]